MEHQQSETSVDLQKLLLKVVSLEKRVFNLESELGLSHDSETVIAALNDDINESPATRKSKEETVGLESRVGSIGLALLGNIVFLFGIIFLTQYIHNNGYAIASSVFGFIATAGILLLANYTKKKVSHLSSMFNIIGQFLLYYVALRLHFFIDNPVISNKTIALILIFAVVLTQLFLAFRKKSELFAGISIVLTLITGIVSDSSYVILVLSPVIAGVSVYLYFKFDWQRILILSLFFVYINLFAWFLKNPAAVALAQNNINFYFLLASAAIFSLFCLAPRKGETANNFMLSAAILNGLGFSLVLAIYIANYLPENYTGLFLFISAYSLLYSVLLKYRSKWEFTPAFYALYGFVAMSVSVYGYYKLPYTFLLLPLQSLLVLSFAFWFRSKIIVTMNSILFAMLLLSYLLNRESVDSINFIFAGVAFTTALVINWKKHLLKIDSELLPNTYLFLLFSMMLFALYKSVADQYITLSWTIAAISYFIYSLIFHNVKFRWLAIFTMIAAAIYLFLVDLSRISLAYRVIAFLFLAIISIGISLYYSRSKKNAETEKEEEKNDQ